ncbi:MAG: hypothetical protein C0596_03620 [Marinilabiliales bacterium]|nr:MAG: hypothetical protein C0596_03620 [Marinilabiliales bacterium]
MYMAIERVELPSNAAKYYDLTFPFEVPEIKSDVQLLKVAEKLFEDDLKRTSEGGKYFTNPSIGAVRVWVEKFAEAVKVKNNTYNVKQAEVENIEGIRTDTDKLLSDVFDTVLSKISSETQQEKVKIFKACGFNTEDRKVDESTEEILPKPNKKGNPGQLKFDL